MFKDHYFNKQCIVLTLVGTGGLEQFSTSYDIPARYLDLFLAPELVRISLISSELGALHGFTMPAVQRSIHHLNLEKNETGKKRWRHILSRGVT